MDVLSALIAYEQKLTMRLSSPSFYCRLLGSKTLLFWVSVQIPSSGALPVRCDGLRGSYNGNWVGRWTNSDSAKGARYQQHTRLLLFILSLLKWRDFNWFCFLLQCWLMSQWGGSCVLRACGTERGGLACPTACAALLRPSGTFGFPSVPRTDEILYPWAWCAEWKELHRPSLSKDHYVSQLYLFVLQKKLLHLLSFVNQQHTTFW